MHANKLTIQLKNPKPKNNNQTVPTTTKNSVSSERTKRHCISVNECLHKCYIKEYRTLMCPISITWRRDGRQLH